MKGKTVVRLGLVLGILLVGLLGLEGVTRYGLFGMVEPGLGESPDRIASFREFAAGRDTGIFSGRPFVGFGLNSDKPGINSLGYRDIEFPLERTEGVPRIACLGASTTEGSMAEEGGSFPLHLRSLLKSELGVVAEVLNFGVSGWTSTESLVNYNLVVQDYEPDLVIIHHSINDVRPRLWPDYKTDYSHYRKTWSAIEFGAFDRFMVEHSDAYASHLLGTLADWSLGARVNVPASSLVDHEWGPPAPETARGFVRNLRTLVRLVRANGGVPLLTTMPLAAQSPFYQNSFGELIKAGVIEHNQLIRELAAEEDVLLLDMDEIWRSEPKIYSGHFIDHVHVTSHGNLLKARDILQLLERGDVPSVLK